ncbi:hypothetical protein [Pedobacter cryoconitis]|uniref:hypothetical protein n=1 Tax=Pedobacter cryoconitis TaxID=188932 RepID=UPI00161C7CB6|nr:hypothetical protein [Pedobacter cryoconitis]MBB5645900.1 hypothetical protein [Pedobacter cryoconitis]
MKRSTAQPIVIPMDFKVACSIYKLDIAEVLQIFIDHVSIYDIINQTYHEGFSEACHAMIWYVKKKRKTSINSKAMKKCSALFGENIRQIEILAKMKRRGWKTTTKRGYTRCFVENIFNSMERLHTPSDVLYLDEFSTLKLSKDFCVLCEAYNCYPKEFLEYFMGYISLSDAHACEGIKGYTNFIFEFFFKIANGFGRDTPFMFDLTDDEIDFYHRMEEVRLEVYIIRDLLERADTLRDFYQAYYQTINPN